MRKFLLVLAIISTLSVLAAWISTGADTGWSKTQVQVMRVDPVTEIEFPEWENRLVLGLDFLVAGLIGSGLLAAISFFAPKPKPQTFV